MFQKSVNLYPAAAVAGDRASQNPMYYTARNFLAGGPVRVGSFVWRDSGNGASEVVNSGSGAPLGFVEREMNNFNYALTTEGTQEIPEGGAVTVALRGDFYVENSHESNAASIGQKAFAKLTDGSVVFAAAGASVSGYAETGFSAQTDGAPGELVIISNMA